MRQLDASTVACLVGLLETYSDRIAPASVDATKRSGGTSSEGAAGSHKEEEEFDEERDAIKMAVPRISSGP